MSEELPLELSPMRPPSEFKSLLVRVMKGCPWNQCGFCNWYRDTPFEGKKAIRSPEEVNRDIDTLREIADRAEEASQVPREDGEGIAPVYAHPFEFMVKNRIPGDQKFHFGWVRPYGPKPERAFLSDSNAILLPTDDLVAILEHLYDTFPSLNRVTSYARAKTVVHKEERALARGEPPLNWLKRLRKAGLTRLHFGLETGAPKVLAYVNKGATAKEMILAGQWAKEARFEVSEYIMPGLGGVKWSEQHAIETAEVLNEIDPHFTRVRPYHIAPGTPMCNDWMARKFVALTPHQFLREMRRTIEPLKLTGNFVFDYYNCPAHALGGGAPIFDGSHEGYNLAQRQNEVITIIERSLEVPENLYSSPLNFERAWHRLQRDGEVDLSALVVE